MVEDIFRTAKALLNNRGHSCALAIAGSVSATAPQFCSLKFFFRGAVAVPMFRHFPLLSQVGSMAQRSPSASVGAPRDRKGRFVR
jgi:hypothetical protein